MEIYNTKSRKYVEYTIQEIISFCDNFLSYQCTLGMATVLENTMYLKDDKKLKNFRNSCVMGFQIIVLLCYMN